MDDTLLLSRNQKIAVGGGGCQDGREFIGIITGKRLHKIRSCLPRADYGDTLSRKMGSQPRRAKSSPNQEHRCQKKIHRRHSAAAKQQRRE